MDPARIRGMQSNFPGENMTIGGQPRGGYGAQGEEEGCWCAPVASCLLNSCVAPGVTEEFSNADAGPLSRCGLGRFRIWGSVFESGS